MKYNVLMESERLLFVQITELLINDYLKCINDPYVQKFVSHIEKHYSYEDEIDWINSYNNSESKIFSLVEKGTYDFVGSIEIKAKKEKVGELGIALTRHKQNKGYGKEAIKRIIDYGKEELHLDYLELNVFNFNERAINCYEKVGFAIDGVGKTENDLHMIYKYN